MGLTFLVAGLGVILVTTLFVITLDEDFKQLAINEAAKAAINKTSQATLQGLDQLSPDPLDLLWKKYGTATLLELFQLVWVSLS